MAEITPATDLSASVGLRGINRPDDVTKVKSFLNAISTEQGGTDGTLNESDTSATGPEFDALVNAIAIFQKMNFDKMFPPDGLVERRRNTHKALVNKSRRPLMYIDPIDIGGRFIPAAGVALDTDGQGFSRAGLAKPGGSTGDWTQKNYGADPIQMVPIGGSRRLVVSDLPGATFTFAISNSSIATIDDSSTRHATVRGLAAGETELKAYGYLGREAASITLRVRAPVTVRVNTVHVGRVREAGAANRFADLLPSITRLYLPQTNLSFAAGSISIMEKLNGEEVDPNKPITAHPYIGMDKVTLKALGIEQPFSITDMERIHRDTNSLTIFFADRFTDFENPRTLGSAHGKRSGGVGGHLAWFRIGSGSNMIQVPAHEMGHLLGYNHITAQGSETYLMNEYARLNSMRIPSDTLTELRF